MSPVEGGLGGRGGVGYDPGPWFLHMSTEKPSSKTRPWWFSSVSRPSVLPSEHILSRRHTFVGQDFSLITYHQFPNRRPRCDGPKFRVEIINHRHLLDPFSKLERHGVNLVEILPLCYYRWNIPTTLLIYLFLESRHGPWIVTILQ